MRNALSVVLGCLLALMMIAGPIGYKRWRDREHRNFHVVTEGVLYRSGQFPLPRLQEVVAQYGIHTVISLRDSDKPTDQDEEAWVKAKALNFVRIPPRTWWPDAAGKIPGDESVATFRAIMDDPANYPVLVHCFAGIHRTGLMCAVYRMDYQGWSNADAMAEMRIMGYSILDKHEDVLGYLTNYRPPLSQKTVPALPAGHQKKPHP
jgi:tyrosine-protein phosphatase SIW14